MQLQLQHISKHFPGVKALDAIDLTINPAEVHALCGENGAGKSTLLNILTGNLQPDEGQLFIDGKPVVFDSPQDAFASGIAIVYQHLSLVDSLSIAENMYASFPPVNQYGFLNKKAMLKKAGAFLHKLNLHELKASQLVNTLSAGQKQMIEIAKALINNPRIVFFDEPTASVTEKEVQVIFTIVRQLKKENTAIVYISHRLQEVFALADTITVLKDGRSQGTYAASALDHDRLIRLMVGREISPVQRKPAQTAVPLLELENFSGPGFSNISFTLHKGEVLGLAGLVGAGRTEITRAIFGAATASSGGMKLNGNAIQPFRHPREAMHHGIAYLPEERKTQGIFPDKPVADNIYVTDIAMQNRFDPLALKQMAAEYCRSLRILTPSVQKKAGELSGGNQQKLLLARWLHIQPGIVLLDEPTHGIDVGAKFELYQLIRQLAGSGKGILLISSELTELLQLCDRILVIRKGMLAGGFDAAEATEEKIIALAMG